MKIHNALQKWCSLHALSYLSKYQSLEDSSLYEYIDSVKSNILTHLLRFYSVEEITEELSKEIKNSL